MPEKFQHQEYRDQLARDLQGIRDHKERKGALESEQESWRYKLGEEIHIHDIETFIEKKRLYDAKQQEKKTREEILEELDNKPIEEIIKESNPVLAKKIEAIRLEKDGMAFSLVRDKNVPEIAFPIYSQSKNNEGTRGKISFVLSDPRLGRREMKYRSLCGCCSSELYDLESPYRANYPSYEKGKLEEHNEAVKKWEETPEGHKDKEWKEQKKQEFKKAMQKACEENDIKYLAMRNSARWDGNYGNLKGVTTMEITEIGNIHKKISELSKLARRVDKELNFEISEK